MLFEFAASCVAGSHTECVKNDVRTHAQNTFLYGPSFVELTIYSVLQPYRCLPRTLFYKQKGMVLLLIIHQSVSIICVFNGVLAFPAFWL